LSASVNLPLHHKVQKFSSGTGSPGWSGKRAVKRLCASVVVVDPELQSQDPDGLSKSGSRICNSGSGDKKNITHVAVMGHRNFVKFGHVSDTCKRADRQTDTLIAMPHTLPAAKYTLHVCALHSAMTKSSFIRTFWYDLLRNQ